MKNFILVLALCLPIFGQTRNINWPNDTLIFDSWRVHKQSIVSASNRAQYDSLIKVTKVKDICIIDTITLTANDSLPNGKVLSIMGNGYIKGAYTFNVNGTLGTVPNRQWIDTGTTLQFSSGAVDAVRPKWNGAKGDSLTDDSKAVYRTLEQCSNSGIPMLIDDDAVYKITAAGPSVKYLNIKGKGKFFAPDTGYKFCRILSTTPCELVKIDGATFDGFKFVVDAEHTVNVSTSEIKEFDVQNCTFRDIEKVAVLTLKKLGTAKFSNNILRNITAAGSVYGIYTQCGGGTTIGDSSGSGNVYVNDNDVDSMIVTGTGSECHLALINQAAEFEAKGNTVKNIKKLTSSDGIECFYVKWANNARIIDNDIYSSRGAQGSINIKAWCKNATVSRNRIYCDTLDSLYTTAIHVLGDLSVNNRKIIIEDNEIYDAVIGIAVVIGGNETDWFHIGNNKIYNYRGIAGIFMAPARPRNIYVDDNYAVSVLSTPKYLTIPAYGTLPARMDSIWAGISILANNQTSTLRNWNFTRNRLYSVDAGKYKGISIVSTDVTDTVTLLRDLNICDNVTQGGNCIFYSQIKATRVSVLNNNALQDKYSYPYQILTPFTVSDFKGYDLHSPDSDSGFVNVHNAKNITLSDSVNGWKINDSLGGVLQFKRCADLTVSPIVYTKAAQFGANGSLKLYDTTSSTSATTGALTVAGGAGIAKDLYVGGTLNAAKYNYDTLLVDSVFRLPQMETDCNLDGAMWYQEEHGSIHSCIDGKVGSFPRVLFVQQNTVIDSNSTAETSLVGTDPVHPLDSFPVGYFLLGKTHRFHMSGIYSTKATSAGTLTIRIKLNTTVICSTIVTLDNNETDQQFVIEGFNVCIDTGTTGKFRLNTGFEHTIAGVSHNDRITTPNGGATVNTKQKLIPNFTFQFSTADVSNKIKSTQFIMEELH